MKKLLALFINALIIFAPFFFASPASAQCLAQDPIIGIISSISMNQYDSATITLSHVAIFNTANFPNNSTNIDQYNAIAKAYTQNNFSLPSPYLASNSVSSSDNIIYASGSAIKTVPYQVGDIVMQGPPAGGSCTQYGFLGFFGKDGVIHYAVADDSSYYNYSYGSDTLSLSAGGDTSCQQQSSNTSLCQVPITYTTHGISSVVVPGQTQSFTGSVFASVYLIKSTHMIIPQNMWIEDFSPTALYHVITFGNGTPAQSVSFTASPTSGSVPLSVIFSSPWGLGNLNGMQAVGAGFAINFGDGASQRLVCPSSSTGGSICSTPIIITHTYSQAGTYAVTVTSTPVVPNPISTTLGTLTITVTGSGSTNTTRSYLASATSGSVPLAVNFSVNNQSFTNIDFGDGNKAAPLNTSCTVGTPGCGIWNVNHTYVYPGNYSALLMNGNQTIATIPISAGVAPQYINPNPLPSSGTCPMITRNLSRGSSGSDVIALQQLFISNGMIPSSLVSSPSGYFGALTEIAVQQWQAAHGLATDGTPTTTGYGAVGPRTRASLANCRS